MADGFAASLQRGTAMLPDDTLWNPPRATAQDIACVRELAAYESLDAANISNLIFDQLCHAYRQQLGDLHGILEAIRELEGGEPTLVKDAAPFLSPPLKGLWHMHYFTARFLAQNLMTELTSKKGAAALDSRIREVLQSDLSPEKKARMMSHYAVNVPYDERSGRSALTGEWVIYAKDESGANYYLAAARHPETRAQDQEICDLILTRCEPRFVAILPPACHL